MSTTKRVSKNEALTACGTHLKKGYKYVKGGGVVKVTASKTAAPKKKTAPKKKKLSGGLYEGIHGKAASDKVRAKKKAAPKKKVAAKKK